MKFLLQSNIYQELQYHMIKTIDKKEKYKIQI